jgi:hypothetical protein
MMVMHMRGFPGEGMSYASFELSRDVSSWLRAKRDLEGACTDCVGSPDLPVCDRVDRRCVLDRLDVLG